ncbi:BMC domain-containing protein [Paenibacillus macerans]|uniref:BMC domain-containing protein n=1 Tax=Paenibacillus macerans TaxID=44252 RepID=UPI002DB558B1|nr:BMC domain-containing protein [Paenibacillus macerans]MEC0330310.1 BMC domain-containing protein [Paenibacillus macerans]
MNGNALGLIEVVGYPAALEAADTCVKSSYVKLLGYEKAKDGRVVVKITGDVGAVKAAVEGAKSSAGKLGAVIAAMVIARPADGISRLVHSPETVFTEPGAEQMPGEPLEETACGEKETAESAAGRRDADSPVAEEEVTKFNESGAEEPNADESAGGETVADPTEQAPWVEAADRELQQEPQSEPPVPQQEQQAERLDRAEVSCNLCGDPLCGRMKGQPAALCLHHRPRPVKRNKDGQP